MHLHLKIECDDKCGNVINANPRSWDQTVALTFASTTSSIWIAIARTHLTQTLTGLDRSNPSDSHRSKHILTKFSGTFERPDSSRLETNLTLAHVIWSHVKICEIPRTEQRRVMYRFLTRCDTTQGKIELHNCFREKCRSRPNVLYSADAIALSKSKRE